MAIDLTKCKSELMQAAIDFTAYAIRYEDSELPESSEGYAVNVYNATIQYYEEYALDEALCTEAECHTDIYYDLLLPAVMHMRKRGVFNNDVKINRAIASAYINNAVYELNEIQDDDPRMFFVQLVYAVIAVFECEHGGLTGLLKAVQHCG